jgi:hypothetical protein
VNLGVFKKIASGYVFLKILLTQKKIILAVNLSWPR